MLLSDYFNQVLSIFNQHVHAWRFVKIVSQLQKIQGIQARSLTFQRKIFWENPLNFNNSLPLKLLFQPRLRLNSPSNLIFSKKYLTFFFFFSYYSASSLFPQHAIYKLLGASAINNTYGMLSFRTFCHRWGDGFSFVFNLFYHNISTLIFGNPTFKKEILAINWRTSLLDVYAWKYCYPFFVFNSSKHNTEINSVFKRLFDFQYRIFFITDCVYHRHILNYFFRQNMFIIGLISSNTNPWTVSYAFTVSENSHTSQLFFLKFLLLINKLVFKKKYTAQYLLWNRAAFNLL